MVRILMRSIINYRYQMESEGQEFMCEDWFNTRIFVIFWVTVVVLTYQYLVFTISCDMYYVSDYVLVI